MRFSIFVAFVATLQISAMGYSQSATVNVHLKNAGIVDVFNEIERQSEYKIFYKTANIDKQQIITIDKENIAVDALLNTILDKNHLSYEMIDKVIVITPAIAQQGINITGKITDESGEPIPGVNVVIKGTTTGVITGADGKYSIRVPDRDAVLMFSFMGYITQELSVGDRTLIEVVMAEDAREIEEVVVIAYGTSLKKDLTGAITSIKLDDIVGIPAQGVDAMIQGKAAGLQVVKNSGTPGTEIHVRVRGTGSLMGESRPLYIIDGVPMSTSSDLIDGGGQRRSAIADINPNDIESIQILKDASSTALYGSRGSNGVILITTKKGKTGAAKISFDSYWGLQSIPKQMDMLNGKQFAELLNEGLMNSADKNQKPDKYPWNQMYISPDGAYTNYQDEIFRNAAIQSYTLSISGGNEKVNTYVSFGLHDQDGTVINQDYTRWSGRMNLDYQAFNFMKIGYSATYSQVSQDKVSTGYSRSSVLAHALLRNPNLPVYDEDGNYTIDILESENPVQLAKEITYRAVNKRFLTNVYAEISFLDNLKLRSTFGIDDLNTKERRYVPSTIYFTHNMAQANSLFSDEMTWQNENTLTFNDFKGKHSYSALAGMSVMKSTKEFLSAGGTTSASDIITTIAISNPNIPNNWISTWGLMSYFARINYNYDDRYLFDASFRVDGSSRFGANKRYGFFPSVSGAWNFSNESFWKSMRSWLSNGKIRFSYGATGNQDGLDAYASYSLYGTGRNYDGQPGVSQNNIANADLGWETTVQYNLGIDLSFFKGRISTYFDFYKKDTKDLIFTRNLPYTSGFASIPFMNLGNMENKGLEITLSTKNIAGVFSWNTDFNISFNKNKITKLPENGKAGSDYIFQMTSMFGAEGPYTIYRVGESVGSIYGYKYLGVYETDADVPAAFAAKGIKGGDFIFEDVNNDDVYSRDFDRQIIGNALPKFIGGLTNTFFYKGFDLSVFMNFSYGGDIYNMTKAVTEGMSDSYNQRATVLNRWKKQGDKADIPRAVYGSSSVSGASPNDASSRHIEDGSFLRINNVSLGYTFNKDLIRRLYLSSARIYVSCQNMFLFTNYSGFDPEGQTTGTGTIPTLGVDYISQPQSRDILFGLQLTF